METRSRTKNRNLSNTGAKRNRIIRITSATQSTTKQSHKESSCGWKHVQGRRTPITHQIQDQASTSASTKRRMTKEPEKCAIIVPSTSRKDVSNTTSGTRKMQPNKETPLKASVRKRTGADTQSGADSYKACRPDLLRHTIQKLRAIAVQEGISTGGQKAQLVQRIKWYQQYNLNSTKVRLLKPVQSLDPTEFMDAGEYHACDERLQQSLEWLSTVQIWSYFIARSARQGYANGKLLKKAGFLRNICYVQINKTTFEIRGYCTATMRKNTMYLMKLEHNSNSITKATCQCPAGQGNSAACKHLGALMLALEEFVRTGFLHQNQTCTEVLQTWHKPPKNTDRSLMYIPIKELYKDFRLKLLPKIRDLPRNDLTRKMLNSSLNRGLHMAVHRSRYVQDIRNYLLEHSYAKSAQHRSNEFKNTQEDSEEDFLHEE